MKKYLFPFFFFCAVFLSFSQSISQIEYFFDNDPGFGNGNQLSFSHSNNVTLNFNLDISNLPAGVHSIFIRAKDDSNRWSLYTKKNIFIIAGHQAIPSITNVEYFWDTDPGFGNGTPVSISTGTSVDQNFIIDITNMSPGVHSLYIRAKDAYNNWSLYTKKNIFIIKGHAAVPDITELEYFFDTDPGFGAGTSLPLTAGQNVDENFVIPLTGLTDGNHELYIRARDSYGNWSLYSQHTVHVGDWGCVYTDVAVTDPVYPAVQDLCNRGLLDNDGQCEPDDFIQRDALAKLAYLSIGLQNHPTADAFPCPFNDLQNAQDTWYYTYAKNLSYLEFDDHKAPFDRNFFNFRPSGHISKAHALKVLLEAFNIDETNNSGSTPFLDPDLSNHDAYDYIVKAYDLGIIDDTFDHLFKPNDNIYRREVFEILHRMLTVLSIPLPTITDDDFFEPGNYTPENFASFADLHSGNFNYYTKTSFAIAATGIPLGFEHTYNSYLSEMPKALIPLQPLGKMWNHTYNSYIKEIPGDVTRPDDYRVVVALPNSGFHIYKKTGTDYVCETKGVYNTLRKPTADKFTITTKKQLVYTYQKIAGTAADFPYVLVSIHDRNGNTIAINYEDGQDPAHPDYKRIKEVTGTAGRKLHFYYQANSDLIHYIEDPLHRKVYFDYDTDGKLISFKDAKNQMTHYNYGTTEYEKDLLMSIQLPKGNMVTNTYQDKKLISTQTNGNQPTTFNYVTNYGQSATNNFTQTTVTDPANRTTEIEYNKDGKPTHIVKDNSTTVDVTYDATHTTKPANITVNGKSAGMTYDNMGNILSINLPLGVSYQYTYNNYNDITQYTDPNGHNYNYTYDSHGNLIQKTTPRGSTTFNVNSKGLVTSITNPEGITTHYTYDNYGNLTHTSAPEGISTASSYDVVSRLLSVTNPNGISINYQYDDNDNLLQETFNGHSTSYVYDLNDNLTRITNVNGVATDMTYDFDNDFLTGVNFGNEHDNYTYYDDGKVHTYTNPNGDVFTYVYDSQGRLTNVNSSGANLSYTYDNYNNILTVTNPNGTIVYTYDALNRITSVNDYFGNTVSYSYDANSNVTKITYPGNKEVNYTYYDDNLLHTVTDWNNHTTTYTYRNDGLVSSVSYPNGTHCSYTYDNAGRQTGLSWKKSDGTVINEYTYALDAMGNHVSETKTEPFNASGLSDDNISYSYNNTNKLLSANGNNNISFGYDTNGNNTSKTGKTYAYDKYDNLISVTGSFNAQYQYDGQGNRRKSIVNGTEKRYVLDILGMSKVLMETDNGNTPQNYYVYGLGLISRIDANNNTNYYHYDFRGSTIAMTDANENITHKYEYNDFGQVLQTDEADFNPYRFVGKYGVAYEDTDLYFMRARYYDPTTGRFLSEDPVWHTNLYPYADNNPVTGIDPKGTFNLKDFNGSWIEEKANDYLNDNNPVKDRFEKIGNFMAKHSDKQNKEFWKEVGKNGSVDLIVDDCKICKAYESTTYNKILTKDAPKKARKSVRNSIRDEQDRLEYIRLQQQINPDSFYNTWIYKNILGQPGMDFLAKPLGKIFDKPQSNSGGAW